MRDLSKTANQKHDLIVIGGGINGAAIANLAAELGWSVVLLEKGDFASGTSSKSTKLIHGGLRYLENWEFDLVRESLKERAIQLESAPHLVKPLGFIVPVYKGDRRPLWMMKAGVFIYDLLSASHCIKKHRAISREEIYQKIPGIKTDGLQGGVVYYDAQMDDARLCLENILTARSKGAEVFNYAEVKGLLKENLKVVGVKVLDLLSNQTIDLKAKKIICAVGPWTNFVLKFDHKRTAEKIRTTKGIHLVYKKRFSQEALFIQSSKDRRIFFIIPWFGSSLIGTTDTDYSGHPDDVQATDEDVQYLLSETQRVFPQEQISRDGIVATFAGLRPLVKEQGNPSDLSRKHLIRQSPTGVYYVIGGKYTTYRKIAQDCISFLTKNNNLRFSDQYKLYGGGTISDNPQEIAQRFEIDTETVQYLMGQYGSRFIDVLNLTHDDSKLKHRICSCSPAIAAQVDYSLRVEMAVKPDDIIWRRLGIGYRVCETKKCREFIESYFSIYARK